MSHENGIEVITVVKLNGFPVGTVLQDCKEVTWEGTKYWEGMHCSFAGSYCVSIEQKYCEIWDEEKHDILYSIKKRLEKQRVERVEREEAEERATLALLKAKYEKE